VPEAYFSLPPDERREALLVVSARSGRPAHLLEKDIWVVWTLDALFTSPFGGHLVFKGGTSLSKAYGIIQRFSEDIDITYDVRAIANDLAGDGAEPLPPTTSQARKWRDVIEARLPAWISDTVLPHVQWRLEAAGIDARLRAQEDCLFIDYSPLEEGTGYVAPSVRVEFGAKSTGEPAKLIDIHCEAADYLEEVTFPDASPRVMAAERTFWEKATAAHAYCLTGIIRGRGAYARHWHDLTKLADAGVLDLAMGDRELGRAVARHKSMFFVEKGPDGPVDYYEAINYGIRLVPTTERREKLASDYAAMVADGLLLDPIEPFDDMMAKCQAIESALNAPAPLPPHH